MAKKEMIAMLLAGGRGSRLGILTEHVAKPAVSFGGKYRIIDFPLSNCINSGIDTVGVLTQYQHLRLHAHIGIGIPWDLDSNDGGVSLLPPYSSNGASGWYVGTADAIYQNMNFIETYDPEYVLVLAADHVYAMDYRAMLKVHKAKKAEVTLAVVPVEWKEAHRFGVLETDQEGKIVGFQEKPEKPRSNLASMGIYIFNWPLLRDILTLLHGNRDCDFGKHVIPYMVKHGYGAYAYRFEKYWRDVGTLFSYWQANMEMTELVPKFNLYSDEWRFYTNVDRTEQMYVSPEGHVEKCIVGEASDIYGSVTGSVIGTNVRIGKGARVKDSIIMRDCVVGENCVIEKAIIAEKCQIGRDTVIGCGEERNNWEHPELYNQGLVTIGEASVIPDGVRIGRNTAISGATIAEDYFGGTLESGGCIIKAGEGV